MFADAHFLLGAHAVCEDYAFADATFAIVCDGCSSSRSTDVGARLLTHAAARGLRNGALHLPTVLQRADVLRRALQLPLETLDATLLTCVADPDGAHVCVWGDGFVAARRRDGELEIHRVAYPSGAPAYPAYTLDRDRLASYLANGLGTRTIDGIASSATFEPARFSFAASDYALVVLASDGVAAVRDRDHTLVADTTILAALTRFPTHRGAFVQRRLRRFAASECASLGFVPTDDIAVAAIALRGLS